jgi:hypothetical protein
MFPENQDINNMINTLKTSQEDQQNSQFKDNSKLTGFKKTINKSELNMPRIEPNSNYYKTNNTNSNFKINNLSKPAFVEEKSI